MILASLYSFLPHACMLSHSVVCESLQPNGLACQAPLSMGFSRQEYWRGVPFPSPGDLPNPRIKPESPVLAGRFFTTESPGKLPGNIYPFPKLIWLGIHFCLETTSFLGVCVPCTSFESSLKCKCIAK